VLKWFGSNEGEAKSAYRRFVKKGIDQGRRPDLVGGGLIENISFEALKSGSRRKKVSAVRSQLARKFVEEWGISLLIEKSLCSLSCPLFMSKLPSFVEVIKDRNRHS